MKLLNLLLIVIYVLVIQPVYADDTGLIRLDRDTLAPLETINITVLDVNSSCTINVLTPSGALHNFSGTISDSNCYAPYIPSYQIGVYEVNAVRDGNETEVDEFTVGIDDWGNNINVTDWQSDQSEYLPGKEFTLTAQLLDSNSTPLDSFSKIFNDNLPNVGRGALYIQRKIIGIDANDNLIARLYAYFDTTGAVNILRDNYAQIYAGTKIVVSLHSGDGRTALDPSISVIQGYENNGNNALSSSFTDNTWTVDVLSTIFQQDKIAYIDVVIPQSKSLSDVIFSVDYIKYNHNAAIGDRVYIGNSYVTEGLFPAGYEFITGYSFSNLGRFPIRLPLNPKPSGMVFYYLNYEDCPGHSVNDGTVSIINGVYTNIWKWKRALDSNAEFTFYADRWGYTHGYGAPINAALESVSRENIHILNYNLDKLVYTEGETRQLNAELKDEYSNPVSGFKMKEQVTGSNSGKLSILTQNSMTDANENSVVRLLLYFDTTGSWSDIRAGTSIDISILGPDGKTGIDPAIEVQEGSINAIGYFATTLTEDAGVYSWVVDVNNKINAADRQVYLDFVIPPNYSASEVVYRINSIFYVPNPEGSWPDSITIRTTTLGMSQFPVGGSYGTYDFDEDFAFGSLGYFPLYLSLNPYDSSIFAKMRSENNTVLSGTLSETTGSYTYNHTWTGDAGADYNTGMCISKYGYFDNKNRCTNDIMLYFSGEPRYLGGLVDEPVMLGTTWEKDLHNHFFIQLDYNDVEYFSSDSNVIITDNIATFSTIDTNDTIYDLIIIAVSKTDPCLTAASDPFTLYAANCTASSECEDMNKPCQCVNYQCEYYDIINPYPEMPQGVDLSVFNEDVNMSTQFPYPGEEVQICADVFNKGTANIFNVNINFYLDDVNTVPIGANTLQVVPTTYFNLPFRSETGCIDWTVPNDLEGPHRIWVNVDGNYPLSLEESMTSNNYATLDFYVFDPNMAETDPSIIGGCPSEDYSMFGALQQSADSPRCRTFYMRIPITVQVCEDEIICGPVTGYELSYWSTWYWPSWSGYCQELSETGDALWALIITYEVAYAIFNVGASAKPSLIDGYNILKIPYSWESGFLPCHPEPTLFPYNDYGGVGSPGCAGLCPVSAWDCGQGVSMQPRFDSPYYHDYAYRLWGGAKRVTRCHEETDYIEIPYQICYPDDESNPGIKIPFSPFHGGPGGSDGGYGGSGIGPPGSGPGGGPPLDFQLGPPIDPNGNSLGFECYFCSTGTGVTNSSTDIIQCIQSLPYTEIRLRKGLNLWTATLDPIDTVQEPNIPLQTGWNTLGYSSPEPFLWSDALIHNGAETKTIEEAHIAGWIQSTIYYFDNINQVYKFVPGDDDYLRTNKAYLLYADIADLSVTLPGATGSLPDNSIYWQDVNVTNGTQTMSLPDAQAAGWLDTNIYYYDFNDSNYKTIPGDDDYIYSWRGHWIRSHVDGLRLITGDSSAAGSLAGYYDDFVHSMKIREAAASDTLNFLSNAREIQKQLIIKPAPLPGETAPEFTLPDTTDRMVTLSKQRGKEILLVFGNTTCPHCTAKIPLLNQIDTDSGDSDFKVIFVAMGATAKSAEKYIIDRNIKFDVLVDTYGSAKRKYGVRKVPEVFIIGKDGLIEYSGPQDGSAIWHLLAG